MLGKSSEKIAAQMKVIYYYRAVDCLQSMKEQIARVKKSCRRCEKTVQEPPHPERSITSRLTEGGLRRASEEAQKVFPRVVRSQKTIPE